MSTDRKNSLSELMKKSWQLVKMYGYTMADAMKRVWAISKLKKQMLQGIVKFMYTKLNGEVRTAWGTLKHELLPQSSSNNSNRKPNETLFCYFDTEKQAFRSFKIANYLQQA